MTDTSAKLFSLAEVSELTGLSHSWLLRFAKRGRLEAQRVGTMWVVDEKALDAFMSAPRRRGPRSALDDEKNRRELEQRFRAGATVQEAMDSIGMQRGQFHVKMRSDPEFKQRMDAARASVLVDPHDIRGRGV